MGKLAKLQRKIAKADLGAVAAGKDPADDRASAQQQKVAASQVGNAIGAQEQIINSQANANAGGNPMMVGAQQQAVRGLGGATGDAAVKESSQANQLKVALREKKKANALALASGVMVDNRARTAQAVDTITRGADVAFTGMSGLEVA